MAAEDKPTGSAVDFYLLEKSSEPAVLRLACKVAEKAWRSDYKVFLLARDERQVQFLDDLLWTYSQASFVPHAQAQEDTDAPVVIGSTLPEDAGNRTALVTLRAQPVEQPFLRLRIADIIGAGDSEKAEARQRFRYYRNLGIEPGMHKL